jgi:DNA-binding MarR family transcriptional regulator
MEYSALGNTGLLVSKLYAVSKLISRLLEKGLVTRKESKTDRRYQGIELTPAAITLVPQWQSWQIK